MRGIERITSRDNRRLAAARQVRDGIDRTRLFIEGKRLVDEALRSNIDIDECFISDAIKEPGGLAIPAGLATFSVPEKLFKSIADTENSQGVIMIARRPQHDLESIRPNAGRVPVVIFLDRTNNPSNLGAVVRTAEAAGACAVIISPGSTDAFSPKVLRASMGSAFRLPVVEGVGLRRAVEWAGVSGMVATAADPRAETAYTGIDWTTPRLLVLGSEAHGLDDQALALVDERIRIPIDNAVESLNLAVSAGVLLFEARRQRAEV